MRLLRAQVADLAAQVAALELGLAARADVVQVGARTGATSTGTWWAVETHQTRRVALAKVALARSLDGARHRTREALAAGTVNAEHARAIVRAVEALPSDVDPTMTLSPSPRHRARS